MEILGLLVGLVILLLCLNGLLWVLTFIYAGIKALLRNL